jgi:hypothetical protein
VLLEGGLPLAALALRVPRVRALIVAAEGLVGEALFDEGADKEVRRD